jgi:hypothetical protein
MCDETVPCVQKTPPRVAGDRLRRASGLRTREASAPLGCCRSDSLQGPSDARLVPSRGCARGRAARVRDASVGGHSRRTTKTSAGVNRNKMDAQVEMPCAGVKTPPHRFDSFSGLRRSGSGAFVSGTEARSIRDRGASPTPPPIRRANARSKSAQPVPVSIRSRPAGASATRVPAAASPGRPEMSFDSIDRVHARGSRGSRRDRRPVFCTPTRLTGSRPRLFPPVPRFPQIRARLCTARWGPARGSRTGPRRRTTPP